MLTTTINPDLHSHASSRRFLFCVCILYAFSPSFRSCKPDKRRCIHKNDGSQSLRIDMHRSDSNEYSSSCEFISVYPWIIALHQDKLSPSPLLAMVHSQTCSFLCSTLCRYESIASAFDRSGNESSVTAQWLFRCDKALWNVIRAIYLCERPALFAAKWIDQRN